MFCNDFSCHVPLLLFIQVSEGVGGQDVLRDGPRNDTSIIHLLGLVRVVLHHLQAKFGARKSELRDHFLVLHVILVFNLYHGPSSFDAHEGTQITANGSRHTAHTDHVTPSPLGYEPRFFV